MFEIKLKMHIRRGRLGDDSVMIAGTSICHLHDNNRYIVAHFMSGSLDLCDSFESLSEAMTDFNGLDNRAIAAVGFGIATVSNEFVVQEAGISQVLTSLKNKLKELSFYSHNSFSFLAQQSLIKLILDDDDEYEDEPEEPIQPSTIELKEKFDRDITSVKTNPKWGMF